EIEKRESFNAEHQDEITSLKNEEVRLRTELANTKDWAKERLALLERQSQEQRSFVAVPRADRTLQFRSPAIEIHAQSQRTLANQNKTNINALLGSLETKIKEFERAVGDAYSNESRERFSLATEIRNLQLHNNKISQDAVNLTNALRGQTKTQGIWGEVIL